jgi:hypothetical protein
LPAVTVPVAPPGDEVGNGPGEVGSVLADAETVGVVTVMLPEHAAVGSASTSRSTAFVRTIVVTLLSSLGLDRVEVG